MLPNPLQSLSADNINTSGTLIIQQDFDNKYVITNLAFVKRMLQLGPDEYGGVEIALSDPGQAESVKKKLTAIFGKSYTVQNKDISKIKAFIRSCNWKNG